ncbi:transmembrane protein 272-like isoform X1 [Dendrobates tinctorius]|uniref:transmembrane protein 272-like isoform X1 n=1 Tax=Dendrobates tinctorius TaxID=92724 RepID=UPI003CCA6A49
MDASTYTRAETITYWTVMSISMIAMGAVYKDNCPLQPFIPIYLMVSGVTMLVAVLLYFLEFMWNIYSRVLGGIILTFSLVWLIAGSVWVFGVVSEYEDPAQCNDAVYYFTFAMVIAQYLLIAVVLVLFFCFGFSPRSYMYERIE